METFYRGTGVILQNEEGKILMIQRADNKKWAFPGGKIEDCELAADAAARELFEETGLTIKSEDLVFAGVVHSIAKIKGQPHVVHSFEYVSHEGWSGEIKPAPGEVSDIRWVALEELPDLDVFLPTSACISNAIEYGYLRY